MVLPLIAALAVPVGAGVGWLTGKALEADGESIRSEGDRSLEETEVYILGRKAIYDEVRQTIIEKLSLLSSTLTEAVRAVGDVSCEDDTEEISENANEAWEKIKNLQCPYRPYSVIFDRTKLSESRRQTGVALNTAGRLANGGHPIAAAMAAGFGTAQRGSTFRGECVSYRDAVKSACAKARIDADAQVSAIQKDAAEFNLNISFFVTIATLAVGPPVKPNLLIKAREWAKAADDTVKAYLQGV